MLLGTSTLLVEGYVALADESTVLCFPAICYASTVVRLYCWGLHHISVTYLHHDSRLI